MPPSAKASTSNTWLTRAVRLVMTRRGFARDLARAYYRLVRALHTGSTIPGPRDPDGVTDVPLNTLREDFARLTKQPSGPGSEPPPDRDTEAPQEGADEAPSPAPEDTSEDDEADRILIEEIARLDEETERIEALAEEEARIALEALGPATQRKYVEQIGDDAPAEEIDKARDEAHTKAGARQAAAAARVAMDGARSDLWFLANGDRRCIGYVRLSRTGTPCGWCAMLISRGPVYRSEASASYSDGDLYHDNCNCYAMPIFTRMQYDGSALYELNRKYAEEWPVVTQGLSGKAALSAWRKHIRAAQQAPQSQVA